MKKIFFTAAVCLLTIATQAQDKNYKTWFQAAQEYMLYEEYDKALNKFKLIEKRGQINANVAFGMGMCYMNIDNQVAQAIPYLEKATSNTSATYKEGNYKEEAAPEEAWFYLGKACRLNGQYAEAIKAYTEFKQRLSASDVYYHDFIALQIESCDNAQTMMANPLPIEITKPEFVIDGVECYFPAVSGDEQSVVFTSYQEVRDPYSGEKDFFELIFFSTRNDDGTWSTPRDITYDIASDGNFSTASLSYYGDMLILYRDDFGNGNLYYANYKDGKWYEIQKFPKNINSKYNETHGSLSRDGKVLFFVSDRPGGEGQKDIYRSMLDMHGNWGAPSNLGPVINTAFDEESAFLCEDDKTLYFSSEGHSSVGGFDIFKTAVKMDGSWSTPQNLGYPINSPYDDRFYNPIGDGSTGYMDRLPENGGSVKEIRKVSPPYVPQYVYEPQPEPVAEPEPETVASVESEPQPAPEEYQPAPEPVPEPAVVYPSEYRLRGRLSLQDNKELNGSFYIHIADNHGNVVAAISPNVSTGEFSSVIKPGGYTVTAYGDGYEPANASIYISPEELNPEVLTFVSMVPKAVSTGEYYSIKSILFDENSSRLSTDAKIEVERLVVLMKNNPNLKIEIDGNTDDLGTDEYNQRLSVLRARAVADYLIMKGIQENHLVIKGLGNTNFIAINQNADGSDNPEGRALNRRVDMRVLNPDNVNVTVENIYVPDELKYRDQLTYTVWITESQKPLSPSRFTNINNAWVFNYDNIYMYTVGLFKREGDAIDMVGRCVDAGFSDAHVINSLEYNQIIQKGSGYYKSKMADLDDNTYTIQLLAVSQPVPKSRFRGLYDVEEHRGNDGLYRYSWGEFIGKKSAGQALDDVLSRGFRDAFIVDIDKYK